MAKTEMSVLTRTFDLLSWLLPATNHFPRAHRYSATQRMLDAAFGVRERLEEANLRRGAARRPTPSEPTRHRRGSACGLRRTAEGLTND